MMGGGVYLSVRSTYEVASPGWSGYLTVRPLTQAESHAAKLGRAKDYLETTRHSKRMRNAQTVAVPQSHA